MAESETPGMKTEEKLDQILTELKTLEADIGKLKIAEAGEGKTGRLR